MEKKKEEKKKKIRHKKYLFRIMNQNGKPDIFSTTSPSDGNYSGKSWINTSLKAAGFRETQCVVHRCLFSVCAMELCLSTPVTVSMVEQYGSMGNKFTRCLGHIVRPICVHPVYMCIGNNDLINVHAPFIGNKPTRWKTKRAIESTDSSGVARLIIERAFIVDSWKKMADYKWCLITGTVPP